MRLEGGSMGQRHHMYHAGIKGDLYCGKSCGKQIRERIERATKRVWVLSPYVDEAMTLDIMRAKDRGVDVKIITSEDALKRLRSARCNATVKELLVDAGKEEKIHAHTYKYFRRSENAQFLHFLRSSKYVSYVHAKMFLVDDRLYIGSVNCTSGGFTDNLEIRFLTEDKDAVSSAEMFIGNLLKDRDLVTDEPKYNQTLRDRHRLLKGLEELSEEDWDKLEAFCKDTFSVKEDRGEEADERT